MPVAVRGMADLQRALKHAEKDVRLGIRKTMREAAEPVRRDAEMFARVSASNITHDWSRMRVGVTTRVVYVAPRQRGVRPGHPRNRPNLARILRTRALDVAEAKNQAEVRRRFEQMLDTMADRFNRGGL